MTTAARQRGTFFLAGLLFFLSGAASLAYEVVWVKLLTLQFGSAAWSITTVVASFMAGLGAGGAWAGRRADRIARPLKAYGLLELGIALYGALSVPLLENMAGLLNPLYGLVDSAFWAYMLAQFLLSVLMLAVPTFLMGASLPLLIVAVSQQGTFRRSVALFYGINTLGAAAGTCVTGIALLPALGIAHSVWVAVVVGILVAAGAVLLDRQIAPRTITSTQPTDTPSPIRIPRLLIAAMALAGCIGLFYQIAWTRMLIPVVGSSVYAFTIILSTVLIGIGVGALLAAVPSFRESSCWRAVALTMGLGALSALAGLFAVNELPGLFTAMAQGTADHPWLLFLSQGALAAAIVFVPACCMGATLPLGIAAWRNEISSDGWAVGGIYAANTAGAILGSVLAGFALLPWLGATDLVRFSSVLGMAAALVLLLVDQSDPFKRRLTLAAVAAASLVPFLLASPDTDITNLQRGVFRRVQSGGTAAQAKTTLLFAREGTNATVTVFRTPNSTVLKVNGKADASTGSDMDHQYLIGHLPMFLHPDPQKVCIIGYGSGATVHAVATHPRVSTVDVVEIEQAVVDASPYFESINHDVLKDPRVMLYTEDGRNFLRHRQTVYDVIVSQPSNPWIAGVSSLFTTEYYQAVQSRLAPDGVFCQWMQSYETSAETIGAILNTLASEFSHIAVFSVAGDLICLASQQPFSGTASHYAKLFSAPAVQASLKRIRITNPFDLFASAHMSHPRNADAFHSAVTNTDDNLWLEYRAPIEMYRGESAAAAPVAAADYFALLQILFPDLASRDLALGAARSIATRYADRWYVIPDLARDIATEEIVAPRLAELAERAVARHRELTRNKERIAAARQLVRDKRFVEAIPLFEAILAVEPANGFAHRMLAWSLSRSGSIHRAWQHYNQAVALNPDDFEAYANMGAIALSQGRAEGTRLLERSLSANPHHFTAWRIYVQYLSDQGQFDRVRQLIDQARPLLPTEQLAALARISSR